MLKLDKTHPTGDGDLEGYPASASSVQTSWDEHLAWFLANSAYPSTSRENKTKPKKKLKPKMDTVEPDIFVKVGVRFGSEFSSNECREIWWYMNHNSHKIKISIRSVIPYRKTGKKKHKKTWILIESSGCDVILNTILNQLQQLTSCGFSNDTIQGCVWICLNLGGDLRALPSNE